MQKFRFRNLQTIEDRTFEAPGMIEALNQVSRTWFGGTPVVDWLPSNSGRVTLLSAERSGNVIGTVYFWGQQ